MTVGRNDPCPCGSGRKYKQCCLRKDEAEAARRRHRWEGVGACMQWLGETHGAAQDAAVDAGFLVALEDEQREALETLPGGVRETLETNVGEWLIADGTLVLGEGEGRTERRVTDLVLGPGGPPLAPEQRAVIEALRDRRLRLYEVVATVPSRHLTLRDALEPGAAALEVPEPLLASALEPGEFAGLRLIPDGEALETSGALYAFTPDAGAAVIERVREQEQEAEARGEPLDAERRQEAVTDAIIDTWLFGLVGPLGDDEDEPAPLD